MLLQAPTPVTTPENAPMLDRLTFKPLVVCWSLNSAAEPNGWNGEMSAETKARVQYEETLWARIAANEGRYKRLGGAEYGV